MIPKGDSAAFIQHDKNVSAFRQRGVSGRISLVSAKHYQSLLIMKHQETKDRLWSTSGDIPWHPHPLKHSDTALCKLKRGCSSWKGFYPVILFPIKFLSPLSHCIDSLPAAEMRWALPIAPPCVLHWCQSVINCFQDTFKVATCCRCCTAERNIIGNRNSFFPIKSWQIILLPVVQKTNNIG